MGFGAAMSQHFWNSGVIFKKLTTPEFATGKLLFLPFYAGGWEIKNPVNVSLTGFYFWMLFEKVELPGFEPGSKQGSHTLSTCLAPTYFSCSNWIRATDYCLIFLISHRARSVHDANPYLRALPDRVGKRCDRPGNVLFQHLMPEILRRGAWIY